jgi:hypothetical protein
MIARHWRGWTNLQDADAYEALLKSKVLPELQNIDGYQGGYILRSDGPGESEFVIVNLFVNMEAVRQFAGPNYTVPVFEPEAKRLLARFDSEAKHYEVRANIAR